MKRENASGREQDRAKSWRGRERVSNTKRASDREGEQEKVSQRERECKQAREREREKDSE